MADLMQGDLGVSNSKAEPKAKPKPARKRRNYAAELQDLQAKVDSACRLLEACDGKELMTTEALIDVAHRTLRGE